MSVSELTAEPVHSEAGVNEALEQLTLPEKSLTEWLIVLCIFGLSVLYLRPFQNFLNGVGGDEGILLQGAQRILQGQVLYRDFFSLFTPGSYYWLAFFFRIFGSSILVARALLLAYGGLFSALTYLLARRVCSRSSASLGAYVVTITCLPCNFFVIHNWDSTLWACLALYCAVWLLQRPHWAWALAAGTFSAFTCLSEQSKGAGLLSGLGVGFAVITRNSRDSRRPSRACTVAFLTGFSWPFVLTLAYFGAEHTFLRMVRDWSYPLRHYSVANKLAFGAWPILSANVAALLHEGPLSLRLLMLLIMAPSFFVPILLISAPGFLIYWSIATERGGDGEKQRYYVLVSAALTGLLASVLATGRPDFIHIMFLGPLVYLILAWIADGRDIPSQLLAFAKPLLIGVVLASSTAFGALFLSQTLNAHARVETRRGTLKASVQDDVLKYVQDHVSPGETMLVYPYHPLCYYLTSTSNPTRYEFLQAGFDTPGHYQQALREIIADRTRVVLFDGEFDSRMSAIFPSTPLSALAARDPVADCLATHYRPCAFLSSGVFGDFVVMVRRDLACPSRRPAPGQTAGSHSKPEAQSGRRPNQAS